MATSTKDQYLTRVRETARYTPTTQTLAGQDIGTLFRQLDINSTGPNPEKSAYAMDAINYVKGTLLQTSNEGKVLEYEDRVRDAILISSFTGRDVKNDVLPNFDMYAKQFTGVDTDKNVFKSFQDYFEANDIQKEISNLTLMLLDIPYNDSRRSSYETMLEQKKMDHASKTADVSIKSPFWRKVASSGNIAAQSVEQLQRAFVTQILVGGFGALATSAISPAVTGIEQMGNALLVGDAMRAATTASAVGYTASTMMKGEAAEIASTLMELTDENGNKIPLDIIKDYAYSWGLISALTEMADDFMTPIGNVQIGKKTLGEAFGAIKDLLKKNPVGYAGLFAGATAVQSTQEGLQGYLRQKGINDAIRESNRKGFTSISEDNIKDSWSESWNIAWDEFKESFIPMAVTQALTGGLAAGATFTTASLSRAMSITPKMRKDANTYFSQEQGRVYDIGYIDTVGEEPVDIYTPKEGEQVTTEKKKAAPILMTINKDTGAQVPLYKRDRQYVEYLRSHGVTGIRGIIIRDDFVSKMGNTASAGNLASILGVRLGEDNAVMGYDGDTIIMDTQEGVDAAAADIESIKGDIFGNPEVVNIEKQENGNYRLMWETDSGRERSVTIRAKNDTDELRTTTGEGETAQTTGNVNPIRRMATESMDGLFTSTYRKSRNQTLEDAEVEGAAKYFYSQITGMTLDEVEAAWNDDYQAIMDRMPEGVDEKTIEQGARFMPLLSAITGRSTDDLLTDPKNRISLVYGGKAKTASYSNGQRGRIEGAMRIVHDGDVTTYEIRITDIAKDTGTALVHELMHIARAMAPEERLAGFVGLKGYESKYGGMWRSDIKETEDGRYRLGARIYDTYGEAAALVEGNEERFVRDFFEYLRTGTAPNAQVASFFGALKQFLQNFRNVFSNEFSDDTRRAFDMLLTGELEIEPEQTIEEAVEASEMSLIDEAPRWEANDYSDDENMYDEEGNPLYSLSSEAQRQYDEVVAKYKNTDQWLKAPNGNPTNLTERQWVTVRTPQFIRWFGDWLNDPENASKVVDENGEPLVVYHGTMESFEVFDAKKGRSSMDIQGMFFSPWELDAKGYGTNVRAFFLNIKNPANFATGFSALSKYKGKMYAGINAREDLIAAGYDGVNNDNEEFIAFNPNQIKSIDNNGEFSNENNSILYSLAENKQWQTMDANTQRRIDEDYERVYNEYYGTDKWMKAPNGQPTKLTERQWIQVRTPAFKEWFGDWENDPENASKIVDENGEPKIVRHGSPNRFETFDTRKIGSTTDSGWYGRGFYFTDDTERANYFADYDWLNDVPGGMVAETFLNIRNPIDILELNTKEKWDSGISEMLTYWYNLAEVLPSDLLDRQMSGAVEDQEKGLPYTQEKAWSLGKFHDLVDQKHAEGSETPFRDAANEMFVNYHSIREDLFGDQEGTWNGQGPASLFFAKEITETAARGLIDGVVNAGVEADEFVAFNPNQIKSATDNIGTFSADNDSILFSLAPAVGSEAFNKWFGNSKIVDTNGNPLVVYHGSPIRGIEEFTPTGATNNGEGLIYATDENGVAEIFSRKHIEGRSAFTVEFTGNKGEVYPIYMSMKHPLDFRNLTDTDRATLLAAFRESWPRVSESLFDEALNAGNHQMVKDMARNVIRNLPAYGYDGLIANMLTDYQAIQSGTNYTEYAVVSPDQVKRISDATLYSLTPEQETRAMQELDSFPEEERNRIAANFDRLKGTAWHREATKALIIRNEMRTLMEGRELGEDSILGQTGYRDRLKAQIKALKKGIEGIFEYLNKASFIANPVKCVHAVNSSLLNCNPSVDCARFCYASEGNYVYWQNVLKSEMITAAVEHDPVRAADTIAKQYKATTDYMVGKALRIFDKGDFSPAYVTLIHELNKREIAVQVFSKRPEFIKQIDNGINIAMLSIDKSNRFLADENPDLAIATVYSGKVDLDFIEANAKRYADHGGVILPVKLGTKLLSQEEIKALPQWARTRYTCPIDAGTKKLGDWNCQKCDINGTGGCFYKNTAENRKYKIFASIQDMDVEAIDEGTRQISAILNQLGISPESAEFRRILENLSRIKSEKLAGIDTESERTGLSGDGEYSEIGAGAGELYSLTLEDNNRIVDDFVAQFPDTDVVDLDGVKYIKHSNDTYTDDELKSIKDSVSETLKSIQLELNFSGQLELDFNGNQGNGQTSQMGQTRNNIGGAGAAPSDTRGLRPGVAKYFDWQRGWSGQEPSTAINNQWDNLGYISFIGAELRTPEDAAKLFSVYRNPKLEYSHIIFTKGNTVAGHLAMSTGVPNSAYAVPVGGVRYIKDYMSRIGADGYYLMHNHPSGDIDFSSADKSLTTHYKNSVPGFRGHIILDHNTFGYFNENMLFSKRKAEGMHDVREEKMTSGFKESYGAGGSSEDIAKSFAGIYIMSMHDPVFSIFYMDYRGRIVDIEDRNTVPTREELRNRMRKGFHSYSVAFTNDSTLFEDMRAKAYYASPKYNFMYVVHIDPTVPNRADVLFPDFYFNTNVWGYVKGSANKSGEAFIPKFQHSDDTGTLYSLSPERQAQVLQSRKDEIQRAVEAGIFVSTEYLEEFRGESWADAELEIRDYLAGNPDVVTLARNSNSVDEFKKRFLKKDQKAETQAPENDEYDDEIPFDEPEGFEEEFSGAETQPEPESEDTLSDTWFDKIYGYAHAQSMADRDRRFAAEWTSSEDKTLELAKALRGYMDAVFNPRIKSRSGGYWTTKYVYNSFKGVSQKVRMLSDGKGRLLNRKERSSSADIQEAQRLIRENPRPYRNAYQLAMMGESRAQEARLGMDVGMSADFMALENIDDDIAQEMERLESEGKSGRKLKTDYRSKYQDIKQKLRDAERDLAKLQESTKSSIDRLNDNLKIAKDRIEKLETEVKENEADLKAAESEYSKLIEKLGGRIENLQEQNAELRGYRQQAKQLEKQLQDRRARVEELRSQLTDAHREERRLSNALNALRRWKEAREASDYRKKRIRQILRLANFNPGSVDASFEESLLWVQNLFERNEEVMEERKSIDERIADLKEQIDSARSQGENVEQMNQQLLQLRKQKKESRRLEPPAQLSIYLPADYLVRADNRQSVWTAEELDTLLVALKRMRADAKLILEQREQSRMSRLMGFAYGYFRQMVGRSAARNLEGEMSSYALGKDIADNLKEGQESKGIKSYILWNAKLQRLARVLDGDAEGMVYDWFVRENYRHQSDELAGIRKRLEAGQKKWDELGLKSRELMKEGFSGTKKNGTEYSLTRGQMLGVYIYSKSELGMEKLTHYNGNNFSEADVKNIISKLTPTEIEWADFMMEDMQDNYTRLRDVYYRGWNMNLGQRENYFTLVASDAATDSQLANGIDPQGDMVGKDGKVYANKDFTKNVNPNAIYPLDLDVTRTWNWQVRKQEHFIAYGEWAKDSQYLFDHKGGQVYSLMERTVGKTEARNFKKIVDNVIGGQMSDNDFDKRYTKWLAKRNSAVLIGNTGTMLKQGPSWFAAFNGDVSIREALKNAVAIDATFRAFLVDHPQIATEFADIEKAYDFIWANAPEMKDRQIDMDIMEQLNRMEGNKFDGLFNPVNGAIAKWTMSLVDKLVVNNLWMSRYYTVFNQQKQEGKSDLDAHKEAAFKASQFISETQPTSMRMDQSSSQIDAKSSAFLRSIMIFTNQVVNTFNQLYMDVPLAFRQKNWKKVIPTIASTVFMISLAAVLSGKFVRRGNEDDKKYVWRLIRELLATGIAASAPGFGSIVSSAIEYDSGYSSYVFGLDTIGSTVKNLLTPSKTKTAMEKIGDTLEDIAAEAGYAVGAPVTPVKNIIKSIKNENPAYLLNGAWGQIVESYK